jgi:predicted helicase
VHLCSYSLRVKCYLNAPKFTDSFQFVSFDEAVKFDFQFDYKVKIMNLKQILTVLVVATLTVETKQELSSNITNYNDMENLQILEDGMKFLKC